MEFLHCSIHRANLHWCEIEHKNQVKKDKKYPLSLSHEVRMRGREIMRQKETHLMLLEYRKRCRSREGVAGRERRHRRKEGLPLFNKICKFSYQKKYIYIYIYILNWAKLIWVKKKKKKTNMAGLVFVDVAIKI